MIELAKNCAYVLITLSTGLSIFLWAADRGFRLLIQRFWWIMLLVQVAAFLAPKLVLFYVMCVLVIPCFATRRDYIAPIYLFCYLTTPVLATPVSAGGTFLFSFDTLSALTLGATIAMAVRRGARQGSRLSADIPVFLLFTVLVFVSARGGSITNLIRVIIENSVALLLPYFVISRCVSTAEAMRLALCGLVAATAALSALAIYEALHAWPLYRAVWYHFDIPLGSGASVKMRSGLLRSPGPFPEPTSFGFCLALGTLAAVTTRSIFRGRARHALVLVLLLLGIIAPQSRGAWLGIAVGVIAADLYRSRLAALGRTFAGIALATALFLGLATVSSRVANIAGLNGEGAGSVDYRASLFQRGLQEIKLHPVMGQDLQAVMKNLSDLRQGEGVIDFVNSYIYIALVAGLIGLTIIVAAVGWKMLNVWQVRRQLESAFDHFALGGFVFSANAAILVMLTLTSLVERTAGMLIIMVAFAAVLVQVAKQRTAVLLAGRTVEAA